MCFEYCNLCYEAIRHSDTIISQTKRRVFLTFFIKTLVVNLFGLSGQRPAAGKTELKIKNSKFKIILISIRNHLR